VVLAGGVVVWVNGGFAEHQVRWVTLQVGESVDLGPLTFTPIQAVARASEGLANPGEVLINIQGECRNNTAAELKTFNFEESSFFVTDPRRNEVDNTRLGADQVRLEVGSWGKWGDTEAFNPTDLPLKCQVKGVFDQGYPNTAEVRLVAAAVEPNETRWSTVNATTYGTRSDMDPYEYVLPLTWEVNR
jgi:hypothetical protein